MERFVSCFAELEDPRDDNARHDLHEILVIAFCAMLCGAEDCSDMALFGRAKRDFLRQFLDLRHGIPSHDTFSRVDRKSTRLNSSHMSISYAVFCLKKKKQRYN